MAAARGHGDNPARGAHRPHRRAELAQAAQLARLAERHRVLDALEHLELGRLGGPGLEAELEGRSPKERTFLREASWSGGNNVCHAANFQAAKEQMEGKLNRLEQKTIRC